MADFDFTQLKGRMAQAGKGGHVELSDLERNALITNAMDGGSVDPEEVQELIDESLEGYYNKFEVDSELNLKQNSSDIATINGSDITHGGNVVIEAIEGQTITVDPVPTVDSENPVQSNGTYNLQNLFKNNYIIENGARETFQTAANAWIKSLGYRYVDVNAAVTTDGVHYKDGYCFQDGTHLSKIGHQAAYEAFVRELPELFNV